MRTFRTEGFIIKRRDLGEADRLLTVFTKKEGKVTIKAQGIRRIPSRRSPHVELLNLSLLTLYKGGGFPVLTEAQSLKNFQHLKNDLTKVGFAYHICELVDGLCPDREENERVFHLLEEVLRRLENCHSDPPAGGEDPPEAQYSDASDIATIIHEFEVELLSTLGYWNKQTMVSNSSNMHHFIENILERRLKSRRIFEKLTS